MPGPGRSSSSIVELACLAARGEHLLELELAVEMVLDHALVAAGDEDEMLDAGLHRLVDHVLDQRTVDHRQHFFRHGLGRGEEARAEPCHGEHGFADAQQPCEVLVKLSAVRRGRRGRQPRKARSNLFPIASGELQRPVLEKVVGWVFSSRVGPASSAAIWLSS